MSPSIGYDAPVGAQPSWAFGSAPLSTGAPVASIVLFYRELSACGTDPNTHGFLIVAGYMGVARRHWLRTAAQQSLRRNPSIRIAAVLRTAWAFRGESISHDSVVSWFFRPSR